MTPDGSNPTTSIAINAISSFPKTSRLGTAKKKRKPTKEENHKEASPRPPSPRSADPAHPRQNLPSPHHLSLRTERVPQAHPKHILHPIRAQRYFSLGQLGELRHHTGSDRHQLPDHGTRVLGLGVGGVLVYRIPGLQQCFAVRVVGPVRWRRWPLALR